MIIVSDIGNTNIVVGFMESHFPRSVFRISTDAVRTSDEYKVLLTSFMFQEGIEKQLINDFILSSVVPPLVPIFRAVSKKLINKDPIIVGPELDLGVKFEVEEPKLTGTDRITNIFEAHRMFPYENACVIDFGTATTFSIVTKDGKFLGGPISIGVIAASNELFRRTAQLPRIELSVPKSAIGKNTVEEMQSGLINGFGGMVDRLIELIEEELGEPVRVIATGGISHIMEGISKRIEIYDKFLTIKGLYSIYERVKGI